LKLMPLGQENLPWNIWQKRDIPPSLRQLIMFLSYPLLQRMPLTIYPPTLDPQPMMSSSWAGLHCCHLWTHKHHNQCNHHCKHIWKWCHSRFLPHQREYIVAINIGSQKCIKAMGR